MHPLTRNLHNTWKWVFCAYACRGEGSIQFLLVEKNRMYFLLCLCRPILRICSLTRSLHATRKWVFKGYAPSGRGSFTTSLTHTQTDRHCNLVTEWAQWADSVNIQMFPILYIFYHIDILKLKLTSSRRIQINLGSKP